MLASIRPQDYDAHLQQDPQLSCQRRRSCLRPRNASRVLSTPSNWTRTTTKWSSKMTACVCFESTTDPAKDRSCTHTQMGLGCFSHLNTPDSLLRMADQQKTISKPARRVH